MFYKILPITISTSVLQNRFTSLHTELSIAGICFLQHLRWSRYNVLLDPFCGENAFGASRPGFIFVWLTCITSFHSEGFQDQMPISVVVFKQFLCSLLPGEDVQFIYIWYFSNGLVQPPTSFTFGAKVNFVRPQSFGCMWRSWWQFCYISLLGDVMEMLQSSVKSLKKKMMKPQICIGTEILFFPLWFNWVGKCFNHSQTGPRMNNCSIPTSYDLARWKTE